MLVLERYEERPHDLASELVWEAVSALPHHDLLVIDTKQRTKLLMGHTEQFAGFFDFFFADVVNEHD